jgi:type I restriction enzyme S subunit
MEVKQGYKRTEVGIIPEDWDSTNVREIASPVRNAIVGGPFGSDLVSTDYVDNGVPVIRGQNLGSKFVSGNFVFVTKNKAKSLEANLAHPSDLVFTQRGTLGQVSLVPEQNYEQYLVSQSQMKLTMNRNLANPVFFYYLFTSSEQQQLIRENTIQTGVPHINLGILRSIPIQRPPLAEQDAIAEALTDTDTLIEVLEQLIVKKRQVKQGAMQELLTGKRRMAGFSGIWNATTLGKSATLQAGINKPLNQMGSGLLYVTVQDLYSGTSINIENLGRIQVSGDEIAAKSLRPGDIVFGKSSVKREGIGYPSQFLGHTEPVIFSGFTFCARPKSGIADATFLFYALRWEKTRLWLIDNAQASALTNINRSIADRIPLLLPPVPEQTAIAEILSDMDAEIAALEGKLSKARQVKQGMMSALLTGRIRLV